MFLFKVATAVIFTSSTLSADHRWFNSQPSREHEIRELTRTAGCREIVPGDRCGNTSALFGYSVKPIYDIYLGLCMEGTIIFMVFILVVCLW
jgi:hypothetical protein